MSSCLTKFQENNIGHTVPSTHMSNENPANIVAVSILNILGKFIVILELSLGHSLLKIVHDITLVYMIQDSLVFPHPFPHATSTSSCIQQTP